EQADNALLLPERRAADIQNVVEPLELDRPLDAQIGARPFRQGAGERHVHGDRAVQHGRVDARYLALDQTVARVDRGDLAYQNVLRLGLGDLQLGLETSRHRHLGESRAGCRALADLDGELLQNAFDPRAHPQLL